MDAPGTGPKASEPCLAAVLGVLRRVTNGRSGVGGLEPRPTGRGAAALALDPSLFPRSIKLLRLRMCRAGLSTWWEASLQPHSSPLPLNRDVCLPTCPFGVAVCGDTSGGRRGLPRFLGSRVQAETYAQQDHGSEDDVHTVLLATKHHLFDRVGKCSTWRGGLTCDMKSR